MKIADAKNGALIAAPRTTRARRTYARQFKSEVVAQCLAPGASVSGVALMHGINANVIRKWLPRNGTATMLPVTLEAAMAVTSPRAAMPAMRSATRPPIELTLAGATVRLPAGFDPQELRSIAQILVTLR